MLHSEPDSISFQVGYTLPEINGKLSIQLQPALRKEDEKEIFQLRITVVGKPESQDTEGMLSWFDVGRQYAVRGFLEVTTSEMHCLWES